LDKADLPQRHREHSKVINAVEQEETEEAEERQMPLSVAIRHSSFVIRHSSLVIGHSNSATSATFCSISFFVYFVSLWLILPWFDYG
jgi:hypothetical protein